MLLGLLLVLSAAPSIAVWGLVMMLAGGAIATLAKIVEMSAPGRDPW